MDILVIYALGIFFCVLFSAFFSGSETALTSVSRARIYRLVMEGSKRARNVNTLRNDRKDDMIGTVLIGNTLVNIVASALATTAALQIWGQEGVLYTTFVLSVFIIIFCEVLPKTYSINHSERAALLFATPLLLIVKLMWPVTFVLQKVMNILFRLFGMDMKEGGSLFSSAEVIRGTIELHHKEGGVEKEDRDMLGSILDLNTIEVGQIMIHRTQMQTIDIDQSVEEIIRQAINSPHSRIPLWRDNPDNILGVLHVKNLFKLMNSYGSILRSDMILRVAAKPWFIPETTSIGEQLSAFRERKQHFAFVVDEYGALLGCVTLEDVIEEIVGEIDDETDKATGILILPGEDGAYHVDGTMPIRDINRALDWNLPDEEASTIAGLIIHEARLIPEKGAVFEFHGFRFTIEERQSNQITRVKIDKLNAGEDEQIAAE